MNKIKEDCFHLGVKSLILNAETALLLERNHPIKRMYWDIPGGRLQKGESQIETLLREVKEETGLVNFSKVSPFMMTLTNIRISTAEKDVGLIFSIFLIEVSKAFNPILSDEHINFQWTPLKKVSEKLQNQYPQAFIEKLSQLK